MRAVVHADAKAVHQLAAKPAGDASQSQSGHLDEE
jgi:hypothetical protein